MSPAHYEIEESSDGNQPTRNVSINYNYSFTFNSFTDLEGGFAPPYILGRRFQGVLSIPPGLASGDLADFAGFHGLDIQNVFTDFIDVDGVSSSTGPPISFENVSGPETLTVQYNFTVPQPTSVPEPTSLSLLILALPAIALSRRIQRVVRLRGN